MTASGLVEIEDARRIVLETAAPLSAEQLDLDASLGRVLAQEIIAEEPVPPFDNSAMDGFAVRAADVLTATPDAPARLPVIGESRAGTPAQAALAPGEAIAISTGAMLPQGADAVVRVEDTRRAGDQVEILAPVSPGQELRRAGEDVESGKSVLRAGTKLGAAELGVLASLDRAVVMCRRRPRVSILVTGDELLAPGEPARAGTVRDSNSHSIPALVRCAGGEVAHVAAVGDDGAATTAAVVAALENADMAIICGGVSVGSHDHVKPALAAIGAREAFWGIALKPGRPTWFGTAGRTPVFGLPGNPVSAMVTFVLLAGPMLRALEGEEEEERPRMTAVLDERYEKRAGRTHAVRCHLQVRDDGWHAQPSGAQGSHILTSMLGADALAMIPAGREAVPAGERVEIEPLARWLGRPC
jgi:molybdopterin molybdotransferase